MTSSQTVADATTPPAGPNRTAPDPAGPDSAGSNPAGSNPGESSPGGTSDGASARTATLTPVERRRRFIGIGLWAVLFVVCWLTIGIPTDPVEAFVWIWAATIAWNNFRPLRSHLTFVRDWSILVLLLVGYNISRGWADDTDPHALAMVHADQHMWGWLTGGVVPTVWLQDHLYRTHIQWYDVMASFVYFSHFVLALTVCAVLWLTNRRQWGRFARRWFTLNFLGLATYFLYPAAPPWWAAKYGLIEPVLRISTRGWDALGLHHAGSVLTEAQVQSANDVAAMPSLHSATSLLVVAFFLPLVRKRWWPLLLAYPLAMVFTLVYSGEHYMIDILFGWIYVAFTYLVVNLAEKAWARYKVRRSAGEPSAEVDDLPQETPDLQEV